MQNAKCRMQDEAMKENEPYIIPSAKGEGEYTRKQKNEVELTGIPPHTNQLLLLLCFMTPS